MSDADAHDAIKRAQTRGVEKVPSPTEISLEHSMKVWGLQLPPVCGNKPGGNTKSPAQGDAQVSKVAAHSSTTRERLEGGRFAVAAASQVFNVLVDPVAHCRHALMPAIESSKLSPGKMPELIRLAVAAWIKIGQRWKWQVADCNFRDALRVVHQGRQAHVGLVADGVQSWLQQGSLVDVGAFRGPVPFKRNPWRERQRLQFDDLMLIALSLDVEEQRRWRDDIVVQLTSKLELYRGVKSVSGVTIRQ